MVVGAGRASADSALTVDSEILKRLPETQPDVTKTVHKAFRVGGGFSGGRTEPVEKGAPGPGAWRDCPTIKAQPWRAVKGLDEQAANPSPNHREERAGGGGGNGRWGSRRRRWDRLGGRRNRGWVRGWVRGAHRLHRPKIVS